MATLYDQADKNIRRTWVLMFGFFVVVVGLGWAFSYVFDNQAILFVAVGLSLVMNVGSFWFSDKIALATNGAKPIEHKDNPDLYNIVENLCITEGIPAPKIFIINDPAPNAFATGRDPKHAALAVTSGLLGMMTKVELEGVIAHELSHIKNRDTLVMMVVIVLLGFVTLLSDFFIRSRMWGGGGNDDKAGQVRTIMILVGFLLAILSPIIAQLIQLAISRKREFLADADGALLTRYPEGLASALQKIGDYGQPMRLANNATAHLFISNPFGQKAFGGMAKLFATHPPIADRIKALLGK
jgi:heat shock protein HtpX